MNQSLFIKTLLGEKSPELRPPVWFMRQAGRSLKSYRDLKEKHTFAEMLYTPELAAKVTLLPLHDLRVDALILFSDILVVLEAMGVKVDYQGGGPKIHFPLKETNGVIRTSENLEGLKKIYQTIRLVKQESPTVPLIGFCGGPLTLFLYLFQGSGHQGNFDAALEFFYTQPEKTAALFELITEASVTYARGQIQNGVDAFQIFETWAGIIPEEVYFSRVMPWVRKLSHPIASDLPLIFFPRFFSTGYRRLQGDIDLFKGISIDHISSLRSTQTFLNHFALQGNLDPNLVKYSGQEKLGSYLDEYLKFYTTHPRWIVNLGHGLLPGTPEVNLRLIVEKVRSFTSR